MTRVVFELKTGVTFLTAVAFQWLKAELGWHIPKMYVSNKKSVVSSCLSIEVISGYVLAHLRTLIHSNFLGFYFPSHHL